MPKRWKTAGLKDTLERILKYINSPGFLHFKTFEREVHLCSGMGSTLTVKKVSKLPVACLI